MDTILSRIQEIASNEGITIGALERAIGASKGVLSRAISNGTDIQSKWIQRIVENYPSYSADWLLSGKGNIKKELSPLTKKKSTLSPPSQEAENISNIFGEQLLTMLREKDNTIREQAEEIGHLRERINQLQSEIKKLASAVHGSTIANAG